MKLIKKFAEITDAEQFSESLRQRGILTHISSTESKRMSAFTGATEVGVWAVLPEQYDIENPAIVLSEDKMREIEDLGKNSAVKFWNKFLLISGLICLAFILYVFIGNQ